MKSVHVIAGLDPSHGGPSQSVPGLCEALARNGSPTTLLFVARADEEPSLLARPGYVRQGFRWDHAGQPLLRDLRASSGLAKALRGAASAADVIHNHGLWLRPNLQAGRTAGRAGKPLVISPRGMLSPSALGFSPLRKRVVWWLRQGAVVRSAACLHATSHAEYEELRSLGLANPVAIIPNGIDVPATATEPKRRKPMERVLLYLGRVHPKKGLDRLLHAWARAAPAHPQWRLRIVGPAEAGHDLALKALASQLGVSRLSIEGPLYGPDKQAAYRTADLFVLPTLSENFGMAVAEALASGAPVICTKGAPWAGLESERCGWWVEHGAEPLAAALDEAMSLPPAHLARMGARGRSWMARDFSWDHAARSMIEVYRWLAGAGPRPQTVLSGPAQVCS